MDLDLTVTARLRRYLPYLGIYASDVRHAIEIIEQQNRELLQIAEHNAALVELAKTATADAVAEANRLISAHSATPEQP